MVKLLLNKGANLSAIDKKERQPIHCAAYLGKQVSIFFPQSCTEHILYCKITGKLSSVDGESHKQNLLVAVLSGKVFQPSLKIRPVKLVLFLQVSSLLIIHELLYI